MPPARRKATLQLQLPLALPLPFIALLCESGRGPDRVLTLKE